MSDEHLIRRILARISSNEEDQPGYGNNPTTLADPKQYRQVVKYYTVAEKALRNVQRLKSQYDRLRSYRYNDPEKAKQVTGTMVVQRNVFVGVTEELLDHANHVLREAKAKPLNLLEKHWVDFLVESVSNVQKQLETLMGVTKGKGLDYLATAPLTIDYMLHHMVELIERFKHTTGVLSRILKG